MEVGLYGGIKEESMDWGVNIRGIGERYIGEVGGWRLKMIALKKGSKLDNTIICYVLGTLNIHNSIWGWSILAGSHFWLTSSNLRVTAA